MTDQATDAATSTAISIDADTWPGTPRLTLDGADARAFWKAVDCAKHALPGPVQRATWWYLYSYHVDCGPAGGYVTATDGYRASRWAFHLAEPGPEFYAPVNAADVDECRKARNGAVSLLPSSNITYPDVQRSVRAAMQDAVRLGRVTRVTPLLRAVSAFERAGFDSIKIGFRGDVYIVAEDEKASLRIRSRIANVIYGDARGLCAINPAHLAGALRAIERGLGNNDVVAELSPQALRFRVLDGDNILVAEELIMTRS
jgi:hypothetical protein